MPDGDGLAGADLAPQIKQDWPTLVAVWNVFAKANGIPLRADASNQQGEFLQDALAIVGRRSLTERFKGELIKAGLLSEAGSEAWVRHTVESLNRSGYENHAFQNRVFGPKAAYASAKRLVQACEHVCRIDVKKSCNGPFEHAGTGILIRPRLVATARHVLKDLLEYVQTPGGKSSMLQAKPGTHGRLQVMFRYMDDYQPQNRAQVPGGNGIAAYLCEDWLAWSSDALQCELDERLPHPEYVEGLAVPGGPWDLALIALARPPLESLTGQELQTDEPPHNPFPIHVLHHPNGHAPMGQRLLWSIGAMGRTRAGNPGMGNGPALRLVHNANTEGGSSGAPVFDSEFRVVALHQGGRPPEYYDRTDDAAPKGNRAVPVHYWRREVDEIEARLPRTDYLPTVSAWDGKPEQAVFGRWATQERIRAAMRPGAAATERLLVVRGAPGQGRRFTVRLIRELVASSLARIGVLDASNLLADGAHTAADKFLRAFGAAPADAGPARDSTVQRDSKLLAGVLAKELDGLAGEDGTTWLIIYGLDNAKLDGASGVPSLLQDLVGALPGCKRVRLVLIGWQGHVPERCPVEELVPVQASDVEQYLLLRYAHGQDMPGSGKLKPIAAAVVTTLGGEAVTYAQLLDQLAPFEAVLRASLKARPDG